MSGHDAEPNDLYISRDGTVWRVVGVWTEPTVLVEMVGNETQRQHLGISGYFWSSLTRIWRKLPEPANSDPYARFRQPTIGDNPK